MDSDNERNPEIVALEAKLNKIRLIQKKISNGESVSEEDTELSRTANEVLTELRALQAAEDVDDKAAPSQAPVPIPQIEMIKFPVAGKRKERLVISRIPKENAPKKSPRNIEKDASVQRREDALEEISVTSADLELMAAFITEALRVGVIEECPPEDLDWTASMFVAKDSRGRPGVYFDFSALRGTIPESSMPIPPESALRTPCNTTPSADIRSELRIATYEAAWPVPLSASDRPKTAFLPPFPSSSQFGRRYRFKMAPVDMPGTNAAIQNVIEEAILEGLVAKADYPNMMQSVNATPSDTTTTPESAYVTVRLDRVLVRGGAFQNHVRLLSEVMNRIKMAGLYLSKEDCKIGIQADGTPANLPLGERRALDALVASMI
ncbi:hypothetical protein HDU97_008815 [Phlyctochytrium planicorne]|nr:hypothetical protein HDU97_008815 [Phlyctochytrium planicorne]